jgi:glycosyltransferase involved in cell wall biosynthesis
MLSAPLVSVVMTSYNRGAYVAEALQSVFNQSYQNLELIVVDDGSTDESRAVIDGAVAQAPFARAEVILKNNGGQASALNRGIAAARGEIVALIDCDDVWRPHKVEALVALVARHPDGGVYQHQVDDGLGRPLRNLMLSGDLFDEWRRVREVNLAVFQHLVKVNVPTSGLAFRREVLDQIVPIPEGLVVYPDFYLFAIAIAYGPLYSDPALLATWRHHHHNAGKQSRFGFKRYWMPVLLPAINAALRQRGHDVRLVFRRRAILFEPFRLAKDALTRRAARNAGGRE